MTILDKLKKYFETTPREQVLKDWEETKENTKNINSPTVKQFLLYNVSRQSEQLESGKTCMMCRKEKENDGHTCCEDCGGVAF